MYWLKVGTFLQFPYLFEKRIFVIIVLKLSLLFLKQNNNSEFTFFIFNLNVK